ncbi:MAG: redoxin domain-containing protein [Gammaproteobacteria bacterium]|nr:redoxin domain-containing protein [Gammaproteobacteria bacterium]
MTRSLIPAALAAVLIFSLVCSTAIRHGHADVPVADTADQIQPLGVGDLAPRFIVQSVASEAFDFNPENLDRPVMLLVFRGGWCPYCNMYLSEMRHVIPEIRSMGIDVLFLSGDRPELLYDSLEHQAQEDIAGLDYTILSDADAQASIALGIAFKAAQRTIDYVNKKGDGYARSSMERQGILPVPAVFAIGRDGVIAFTYINPNYKVRLPADDLLAAARAIAAAD